MLVTGGAGLIGSFLVERLLQSGASVIVADDFSKGRREHLAAVLENIEIREGDLEDVDVMRRAVVDAELIFHLASRTYGVGYAAANHLAMLDHNERISNNLLRVLVNHPVAQLMVASSSCVYADDGPSPIPELPIFVGQPEMANWGYGWAKRMLEQKAMMLARETGTRLTIARPFNIYGERYCWAGEASQAIPMLVKKVMDGDDPVVIWGSGRQRRNYLHARDCADAMVGIVEAGFTGTINIGTEDTISLTELVQTICRLAGRQPRLVTDISQPQGRAIKSADATLLRQVYRGFRSSVSLERGLARMIDWYFAVFGGHPA